MALIVELHVGTFEPSLLVHPHFVRAVDENVRDIGVREERRERAEPEHLVEHFTANLLPMRYRHAGAAVSPRLVYQLVDASENGGFVGQILRALLLDELEERAEDPATQAFDLRAFRGRKLVERRPVHRLRLRRRDNLPLPTEVRPHDRALGVTWA